MEIFIASAVLVGIVIIMLWWVARLSKTTSQQNESNAIINNFEPDNVSETLTEMIEFHKRIGNIEYKLPDE